MKRDREAHANRVWGPGNWVRHEDCPDAIEAGQTIAYHHVDYHRFEIPDDTEEQDA